MFPKDAPMPAPQHRALDQVLASTSDVLFPEFCGEKAVDINSVGMGGDTPLHVMAWRQDAAGADALITAGADVNAIGEMGETPLHVALRKRDRMLVKNLVLAGARTDIRSEFGDTADEMATREGVTDWLLAASGDG